jgi:hypothetical protein
METVPHYMYATPIIKNKPITDSKSPFYEYHEKYFAAKWRNKNQKEISHYALMSLAQIHQISGKADQSKAAKVMHDLMGLVLTPDQTREMYYELREPAREMLAPLAIGRARDVHAPSVRLQTPAAVSPLPVLWRSVPVQAILSYAGLLFQGVLS